MAAWLLTQEINSTYDVFVDHHGNVYLPDQINSCVRKVTPAGIITTIAGTGVSGYNGDGIAATTAQLNVPRGVAVDSMGNVYIADGENFRIRKVDTAGIITTIAGTGVAGFSPDGSHTDTVKLDSLASVRIDKAGNIFFADNVRIRKIDTAGIITTIAGNGIIGYSGDSGMATAAMIGGGAIAIDTAGNLFIADGSYHRIREVNTVGIINTIAGNGAGGFGGDGGSPLLAKLLFPQGVVVSNSGDVYIGDVGNNRIRLVTTHPMGVTNIFNLVQSINIYPNPCHDYFTARINSALNEQAQVIITDITGTEIRKFTTITNQLITVQLDWPRGIYVVNITTENEHFTKKIVAY